MRNPTSTPAQNIVAALGSLLAIACAEERNRATPPAYEFNTWAVTFGGVNWEEAVAAVSTSDGGFLIVGVDGTMSANSNTHIVKVDSNGQMVAETVVGGTKREWVTDLVQVGYDEFVVAGVSDSWDNNPRPYAVLISGNGNVIWERVVHKCEFARSVATTSDGGLIFVGKGFNYNVALIKTDDSLNLQWAVPVHVGETAWGTAVAETEDHGFIIVASAGNYGQGGGRVLVVGTDSTGQESWSNIVDFAGDDWGTDVTVSSDGSFVVCGRTGSGEALLVKFDSKGDRQWQKTFRRAGPAALDAVITGRTGGYVAAGSFDTKTEKGTDAWIVHVDNDGEVKWESNLGGPKGDAALAISHTQDGGFIIAGKSVTEDDNIAMYAAKVDSLGHLH